MATSSRSWWRTSTKPSSLASMPPDPATVLPCWPPRTRPPPLTPSASCFSSSRKSALGPPLATWHAMAQSSRRSRGTHMGRVSSTSSISAPPSAPSGPPCLRRWQPAWTTHLTLLSPPSSSTSTPP
uniref:Uncharacterized protein n=1 Tax=Opuntia streptacantha TaxID=393608 RepID=A0A7C8YEE2_OPUST